MFETLHRLMRAATGGTSPARTQDRDDRINSLQLDVGDTLIISTDKNLTTEERQQLSATCARRLREGVHVLVLDGGMKVQTVLTQSSIEAQDQLLTELRKNTAALRTIADSNMEAILRTAV